jgi:hypothetical protein
LFLFNLAVIGSDFLAVEFKLIVVVGGGKQFFCLNDYRWCCGGWLVTVVGETSWEFGYAVSC